MGQYKLNNVVNFSLLSFIGNITVDIFNTIKPDHDPLQPYQPKLKYDFVRAYVSMDISKCLLRTNNNKRLEKIREKMKKSLI